METDVELQETATGFQVYYFFFFLLTVRPPLSFPSSLEKFFPFSRHKSGVSLAHPCPTSSSRYPERSPWQQERRRKRRHREEGGRRIPPAAGCPMMVGLFPKLVVGTRVRPPSVPAPWEWLAGHWGVELCSFHCSKSIC